MTTEQARNYFAEKGFTYENVTEVEICILLLLLKKHIKQANKENKTSVTLRMSEKIKGEYKADGTVIECYLFLNSDYFTRREAISFNKNGFIGFAGWADDGNKEPLIKAFVEWVDII